MCRVTRRRQCRAEITQQGLQLRRVKHRRLDQQRAGLVRHERGIVFDKMLDLLGLLRLFDRVNLRDPLVACDLRIWDILVHFLHHRPLCDGSLAAGSAGREHSFGECLADSTLTSAAVSSGIQEKLIAG